MIPKERLIECFRLLCEREGGPGAVASATGANVEGLRQILRGHTLPSGEPRGVGPSLQKRLTKVYPDWMTLGVLQSPPTPKGVAHASIQPPFNVSPSHQWGDLMPDALPSSFSVALPDDSMAPDLPAGSIITFAARSEAVSGEGVLVSDKAGTLYFRQFRARTASSWQAIAKNPVYLPLDSDADGLTVVAVMTGMSKSGSMV